MPRVSRPYKGEEVLLKCGKVKVWKIETRNINHVRAVKRSGKWYLLKSHPTIFAMIRMFFFPPKYY